MQWNNWLIKQTKCKKILCGRWIFSSVYTDKAHRWNEQSCSFCTRTAILKTSHSVDFCLPFILIDRMVLLPSQQVHSVAQTRSKTWEQTEQCHRSLSPPALQPDSCDNRWWLQYSTSPRPTTRSDTRRRTHTHTRAQTHTALPLSLSLSHAGRCRGCGCQYRGKRVSGMPRCQTVQHTGVSYHRCTRSQYQGLATHSCLWLVLRLNLECVWDREMNLAEHSLYKSEGWPGVSKYFFCFTSFL